MTIKFGKTYTVKVIVSAPGREASSLAALLQRVYDDVLAPAGAFEIEKVGDNAIITFIRNIAEDSAATTDLRLYAPDVVKQLALEYHQAAFDDQPLARAIFDELNNNRATVNGLPCQYPMLTLTATWSFKDADRLAEAKDFLLEKFNNEGGRSDMEHLFQGAIRQSCELKEH